VKNKNTQKMTFQKVICRRCNSDLGEAHQSHHAAIITRHFKEEHKEEYEMIQQAKTSWLALKRRFGYIGD
jgi:hypothetical protein